MQTAAEVRRASSKRPRGVRLDNFRLEFKDRDTGAVAGQGGAGAADDRERRRRMSERSRAVWTGLVGTKRLPVRVVKAEGTTDRPGA